MYVRHLFGRLVFALPSALLLAVASGAEGTRLLPASGDFITYVTTAAAEADGWRGNYNSRLGVVGRGSGYAIEARGASHHGGMAWFPEHLDLSGAKRLCFKIRQNVHRTYSFTWVLQFEGGLENVARVVPGGAGWGGWKDVELDLGAATLGKLRKMGIYMNGFRDTESKYLQLDELHFVMPGKEPAEARERPLLTVPRLDAPPVLDGIVGADEWAGAAGTMGFVTLDKGLLSDRQTHVYVGFDETNLYVAYVSDYSATGDFDRGKTGRLTYNDLAEVQDFIELWVQPNSKTYRQFMINMNGGVFERDVVSNKQTHGGARAASSIEPGEYLSGGMWSAELIIPFEDLGGYPKEGETWRVLFCRDYRSAGGSRTGADWTSSVFTQGDFNKPQLYGSLSFSSHKPVVRLTSLGRMREGDVVLKGDILVRGVAETRVALSVVGHDTGSLLKQDTRQSLIPGRNPFELGGGIKSATRTKAVCRVTIRGADDDAPIYRNSFPFLLGTPLRLKCVSQARSNSFLVDVAAQQVKGLTPANRVTITVRHKDREKALLSMTFPYPEDAKNVVHPIDCGDMEAGYYRVEAEIASSANTVLARSTEPNVWIGAAEWANNTIGISDDVPMPWTPIEIDGGRISIAERLYTVGRNGLPASIIALGKELLSRPAELLVQTEHGRERCDFKDLTQLSASPSEVVLGMEGECRSFWIHGTLTIGYDGLALWRVEFTPRRPLEAADLALVFSLPAARSLYARGKTIGSTASGYVAILDGVGKASEENGAGQTRFCASGWPWRNRFFYEVFVGDDDSGIVLMTEGAQYHQGKPHVAIAAAGSADRTFRVQLTSGHGVTPRTSLRYEYAWVGLPLRPRPLEPNAWHVTIGPTGTVDAPIDAVDPELFRRCPIVIAGRLLRYDSHYQVIDPDPAKRVHRRAGHQRPDVIGGFVKRVNQMGAKVVTDGVYWADADTSTPEARRYLEEWKLVGSGVSYWNYQDALDIGACARSSWLDFQTYAAKRILENGINGVYLDVSAQSACRNLYHGCGYLDPEGTVRKTINLWAIRELHQRVYTYYKSLASPGAMYHHHLDSAAWAGFCDGGFQGEELASERGNPRGREYQNMAPELFRAMTMNQYGTPYTWYALFSYYGRTPMTELMAICLPHNVMPAIWNVRHNQWRDIKPYWDVLDEWWTRSDFVGYWHPRPPAKVDEKGVLVSAFVRQRAALLVVANWNYSPLTEMMVEIDGEVLGVPTDRLSLTNALTGHTLSRAAGGRLTLGIGARDVSLILVGAL